MDLLEAFTNTTLRCAVLFGPSDGVQLTQREKAIAENRRYDREEDRVLGEPGQWKLAQRLEVAVTRFPQFFGADYVSLVGTPHWQALSAFIVGRNSFVHPRQIEDFLPNQIGPTLDVAPGYALWLINDVLSACLVACGRPPLLLSQGKPPEVPSGSIRRTHKRVFDGSTMKQISELEARGIAYHREFTNRAFADLRRADLLFQTFKRQKKDTVSRLFVRSVFAMYEAITASTNVYMTDAAGRGELSFERPRGVPFLRRQVSITNQFSNERGQGSLLPLTGPKFEAISQVHEFRDRMTHPLLPEHLKPPMNQVRLKLAVCEWTLLLSSALLFNLARLAPPKQSHTR